MKKGWELKKLVDVCHKITDGSHTPPKGITSSDYLMLSSKNIFDDLIHYDDPRFLSPKDFENENKRTNVCSGDVLLTIVGTIGRVAVVPIDYRRFTLQRSVAVLKTKKDVLDSRFLMFALQNLLDFLTTESRGAAQKGIYLNQLKEIPIQLPPLSEQKQIVSVLDDTFEKISIAKSNAEQNLKNARELFESYLQGVFENKGEDWIKDTLETLLEKGWILSHLDGNHGGDYPKREEFKSEGVPYISANCLRGTDIDFSLAKHLSYEKAATFRKGVAKNNDVLFAHNATVGPVALLKTDEEKVILGTSLTYYRCNAKYILPEYLANYMRSKEFKQQYEIVMRQSTRNQVPITKQREFYHIIPPIEFQKIIIIKLDALLEKSQRLEEIYSQKINDLEELKKSVLQKAFNGELNITPNNK